MCAQLPDPGFGSCLLERQPNPGIRDRKTAKLNRARKDPVVLTSELGSLLPALEHLKHPCIDRHQASRVDGLYIIHSLPHDRSLNSKFAAQPVHVSPFESKTLTDAQTKTNTNQGNRVNGFFKTVDEHPEFIHCQAARLALALAAAADSVQLHRVTLDWHLSAPHRVLPKRSNETANMNHALGGQWERP